MTVQPRERMTVSDDGPCLVVAEVAQAHDGSLGTAHAYIDAVADAGADAVKFQTHIAEAESTPGEPWRVKFSPQDETRFDYWKRMEFTEEQWRDLRDHALERDLFFLSSPFSEEAVELLTRVGVGAWKVASGEIASPGLLDRMLETGWPVILSSGMSPLDELDRAVESVRAAGVPLAVLQCTSAYPCPPEKVGLNVLGELRERYGCPVGLSDHSGTIFPGLAAVTLGAKIVEIHVTLSREAFGPDVPASVTTSELGELTRGVAFIEKTLANPVDKNEMARELQPLRELFTKSLVAARDLAAGTVLRKDHLTARKPGTGIPASRLSEVVGSRIVRDVDRNEFLSESDLEEAS